VNHDTHTEKAGPANSTYIGCHGPEAAAEIVPALPSTVTDAVEQYRELARAQADWIAEIPQEACEVPAAKPPGPRLEAPSVRTHVALVAVGVLSVVLSVSAGLGLWWLGNQYECSLGDSQAHICEAVAPSASGSGLSPTPLHAKRLHASSVAVRGTEAIRGAEDAMASGSPRDARTPDDGDARVSKAIGTSM
jgi:hypothetical protein